MIMAIVMGVTGSLMSGFVAMFESVDDLTISRRRAQDVFNIMKLPVKNAGLGFPVNDLDLYFGANKHYTPSALPVLDWSSSLEVLGPGGGFGPGGNKQALRVLYSIPSGSKNEKDGVDNFIFRNSPTPVAGTIKLAAPILNDPSNPEALYAGGNDVRAFVTFSGIHMSPLYVNEVTPDGLELTAAGVPSQTNVSDRTLFIPNYIWPYHDMYFVRAGLAYVDDNSNFIFLDVPNAEADPSAPAAGVGVYPDASDTDYSGFRIEGIRGISFDLDPDRRYMRMWVLAEGDIADSTREGGGKDAAVRARWQALLGETLNPEIFYEEFSTLWRTRNIQTQN
jgi:hypothetical protein